ncbi:MAG: arginine/lysine/ornithine decarboxylase [Duodenibacillus sp.]|nr:arginine/lysine/ornithine decarboxylase [Duodenibacillus sp.]
MLYTFPVVIIDEDYHAENVSGLGIRDLAQAIEAEGLPVRAVTAFSDLSGLARQASRASAFIVCLDDEDFAGGGSDEEAAAVSELRRFVGKVRAANPDVPIFLHGETRTATSIPNDVLRELHGFIHLFEDTPEFVARYICREARGYLKSLPPPFFRALTQYAAEGSYSWHCPGHSGGVAFLKSPVGQMFHQFFGENMLRSDVCNAVEALGQLLDHTGPVARSEQNAARIFGSDHCFFVTNGTSTSNKIVWNYTVAPGDVVVVDRNCHKSILHAITLTGAVPVFLRPTRNHYGIIGPIPREQFDWAYIQGEIDRNPLIKDKRAKPRILTITQSTYDGIVYNDEVIKAKLDGKVDSLHFDEAWLPHAAFHELYDGMHGISRGKGRTRHSIVFCTHSTHKLLAGLSQASQICVQDSETEKLDRANFNESFMMHTSTSPLYPVIASCDVAAAMMEGRAGHALIEEAMQEAVDFRRAMRAVGRRYDWWFKVWGPDRLPEQGVGEQKDWLLAPGDVWHGFGGVDYGFNMLDPIKGTVLTPGLSVGGEFDASGIPAAIVSKYLAEHGIVVEKTGLYSFFIMFTIGITKGRWNTLVTELQQFKDAYDANAPLWRVMPGFAQACPAYEETGLRDLCQRLHDFYKANDVARLTTEMYTSYMEPAMRPTDAYAKLAHAEIDRIPFDELEGRISAVLLTPYPPGIPLLVPGERVNRKIVEYLRFAKAFTQAFPGFENDVHGLVKETGEDGEVVFKLDCVREDSH